MDIEQKIREILRSRLSAADKIVEIENYLPEERSFVQYTNFPLLEKPDDLYYTGSGCTWDIDLQGRRYWKRYHPSITKHSRYTHLCLGDIIDEKERIKEIVRECLCEMKILSRAEEQSV